MVRPYAPSSSTTSTATGSAQREASRAAVGNGRRTPTQRNRRRSGLNHERGGNLRQRRLPDGPFRTPRSVKPDTWVRRSPVDCTARASCQMPTPTLTAEDQQWSSEWARAPLTASGSLPASNSLDVPAWRRHIGQPACVAEDIAAFALRDVSGRIVVPIADDRELLPV